MTTWPTIVSEEHSIEAGSPELSSEFPAERPRFLSEADCQDIAHRLARVAQGGGDTFVFCWSTWTGYVRWARNLITTSGEVCNDHVNVWRDLNGARTMAFELINDTSDDALIAAARRAERTARLKTERPQSALYAHFVPEPAPNPTLFFETTYELDAAQRAAAAQHLVQSATQAGMLAAGYLEVAAHSMAVIDTQGRTRYCAYTTAQYSVTVRDPKGIGSGWAGVDWPDWTKIDGDRLSAIALDKCLKSRNPVAIEPGRYTTILEPQAVSDFVSPLMNGAALWLYNLSGGRGPTEGPFGSTPPSWSAKKGEKVIDARLSITADPLDPELGFPAFNLWMAPDWPLVITEDYEVYHPATWIENGILKNLAYDRDFARERFGENTGLPNSGAFRMGVTGPTASVAEMIATTMRGLLVTRFDRVMQLDGLSQLNRGLTRDGLWLIENGKIFKPVKNMVFTESILFALNNVEQVGVPQRVFHPKPDDIGTIPQPVIVPPLKVKDFSFTALTSAI